MIMTMIINGVLGLAILVAMLFCMGDIVDTVNTPTGFPFIAVFTYAMGSNSGGTALVWLSFPIETGKGQFSGSELTRLA